MNNFKTQLNFVNKTKSKALLITGIKEKKNNLFITISKSTYLSNIFLNYLRKKNKSLRVRKLFLLRLQRRKAILPLLKKTGKHYKFRRKFRKFWLRHNKKSRRQWMKNRRKAIRKKKFFAFYSPTINNARSSYNYFGLNLSKKIFDIRQREIKEIFLRKGSFKKKFPIKYKLLKKNVFRKMRQKLNLTKKRVTIPFKKYFKASFLPSNISTNIVFVSRFLAKSKHKHYALINSSLCEKKQLLGKEKIIERKSFLDTLFHVKKYTIERRTLKKNYNQSLNRRLQNFRIKYLQMKRKYKILQKTQRKIHRKRYPYANLQTS